MRTPLDRPLLIFYGVTLLSTFIAIFQSSVEVEEARRATRVLSYYLTFFIVTNLVRERRQLNFLLNGLFLLATIVAAAMVAQFLLGDSVQLLPGRVESLDTQGTMFEDVTRILPPGCSIVLVSFVDNLMHLGSRKIQATRMAEIPSMWLIGNGALNNLSPQLLGSTNNGDLFSWCIFSEGLTGEDLSGGVWWSYSRQL